MRFALALCLALAGCHGDAAAPIDGGPDAGGLDGATRGAADLAAGGAVDLAAAETVVRVHYPAGAHPLFLRGGGGPWTWDRGVAMQPLGDDTWSIRAPAGAFAGATEWKPLLDDSTWSRGANYRVVPGATVDVYPHFQSQKGQVVKLVDRFHSAILGDDRAVWAYLPPSYSENMRASYPVLYMHDGQNLFDPALAFGGHAWMVDGALDAGAETADRAQAIREAIVVGPENTAARIYQYTPTRDASVGDGGGGDGYLRMLIEELKPLVDGMLRTRSGRAETALIGSSLGGLISVYGGVRRPDLFGLIGALSPSTWWDNQVIIADVTSAFGGGRGPRPLRVYVDSGDAGPSMDDVADTNRLAQAFVAAGWVEGADFHHLVQAGGQHNEVYWAERLPGALRFLLAPLP